MGKRGSDLPKNARLQLILDLLKVHGSSEGITAKNLLEILHSKAIYTSIKTIYRDLIELSLYSPITSENDGREIRWIWTHSDNRINIHNEVENKNRIDLLSYLNVLKSKNETDEEVVA